MCEKYLDDLSMYIDGMLEDSANDVLEEHLKTCSSCKQVYKNLIAVKEALNHLDDDIEYPEELHSSIMSNVNESISADLSDSNTNQTGKNSQSGKIIRIDFKKSLVYCAASIIGLTLIFTPALNTLNYNILNKAPKTTVMADDLNLEDRLSFFTKNQTMLNTVTVDVAVNSNEYQQTIDDLLQLSSNYGEIIDDDYKYSDSAPDYAFVANIPKDDAPEFVSYIVDNYTDTTYVSSKEISDDNAEKIKLLNSELDTNNNDELISSPDHIKIIVNLSIK